MLQARQAFLLSISLVMLTFLFLYSRIQKSRQTHKTVKVKVTTAGGEVEQEQTFLQHDVAELKKLVQQTLLGCLVVGGLHYWKGFVQPLVFQSLLIPLTVLDHQLFHLYILGRPATGDLERPWKDDNPFAAWKEQLENSSQQQATGSPNTDDKKDDSPKKAKKEGKKQK
mmetsp:Transcript_23951/g.57090  ORF Transcript_23951/g.57090 Transcript_23951/m.57090 type:complete len:169 (+) Transcript_23951:1-507(+)